jgi:Mg2+ and Co2+ transporter CorA
LRRALQPATAALAFADEMEEEDIDIWYEDEKQRIFDIYVADVENGLDQQKSLAKYEKRLEAAYRRYSSLMNRKLDDRMKRLANKGPRFLKIPFFSK